MICAQTVRVIHKDQNLGLRALQPICFTLQATQFTSETALYLDTFIKMVTSFLVEQMQILPEDKMRRNFFARAIPTCFF